MSSRDPNMGGLELPPLDLLLYARSRADPRYRLEVLTAVRMAYPALHRDPDWMSQIQELLDRIGLDDAEHAAMVRRAELMAKALRQAFEDERPPEEGQG